MTALSTHKRGRPLQPTVTCLHALVLILSLPMEHRWKELAERAHALAADGWKCQDCIPWLHDVIDLSLSYHSRSDLQKMKQDDPPFLAALIDEHLAERFWKYGERQDDSKAPD